MTDIFKIPEENVMLKATSRRAILTTEKEEIFRPCMEMLYKMMETNRKNKIKDIVKSKSS